MTFHFPVKLPPGAVLDGYYEIDGYLGSGGFADVYSGVQRDTGLAIAVKILRPVESGKVRKTFQRRFLQEARAAATIKHPHIVTMLACRDEMKLCMPTGDEQTFDRCYIAMERLTGHDLQTELEQKGAMSPRRVLRLMLGCLDGLALGHELGIIHKDLKPANLFLLNPGRRTEMLKILDFGIARVGQTQQEKITQTGKAVYTPQYAAPEYLEDLIATPALDVYQMGLILTEMLTGQTVVQGHTVFQCMLSHSRGITLPQGVLGSPLGAVLAQATTRDHTQRFPNAGAFCEALEEIDPQALPKTTLTGQAPAIIDTGTLEPVPNTDQAIPPSTGPGLPHTPEPLPEEIKEPVHIAAPAPGPSKPSTHIEPVSRPRTPTIRQPDLDQIPPEQPPDPPPPRPPEASKGGFNPALFLGLGGAAFFGLLLIVGIGLAVYNGSKDKGDKATAGSKSIKVDEPEFSAEVKEDLRKTEEEVNMYLRKAEKAMAEEEWEKALVYLGEVLEKEPNNKEANAKRSQASLEKGMKKFYKAGKAALESGDHNDAMENFNKIPEGLSIYHKRIKDDGLLQKAIDASVVDMLEDGRALFKNRDYPGALAAVDAVLKIDRNNPDAKKLRKAILSERNKLASNNPGNNSGEAPINKISQGNPPKSTEVKIGKKERKEKMNLALKEARTNSLRGNITACISKANEAKKFGAGVSADYILGICYEKQGNGGLAAKHYNNWLRANPSSKIADKVRQKIIGFGKTPVN